MDNDHLSPAEELKLRLPPDAESRVIKVSLFRSSALVATTLTIFFKCPVFVQEARKEGLFAGLTGGLTSGKPHVLFGSGLC